MNEANKRIIDFALDILSGDKKVAIELFRAYSDEKTTNECLDYKERLNPSDTEVMEYLKKLKITTMSELQRLKKEQRDDVISRKFREPEISPMTETFLVLCCIVAFF